MIINVLHTPRGHIFVISEAAHALFPPSAPSSKHKDLQASEMPLICENCAIGRIIDPTGQLQTGQLPGGVGWGLEKN